MDRKLGEGAYGIVYLAYKENNPDILYALKTIKAESAKQKRRFKREIKAMREVQHRNIVSVHDAAVDENVCYMVMDYIEGETLEDIIHKDTLTLDDKVDVIHQAAKGLQALHSKKIYHRDIKPANILIDTNKNVYITDFGIAKFMGHEESMKLTKTGAILGTPSYLSPEQAEGEEERIDHRSDIYSLGATLYELLTNKKVIEGDNTYEVLLNIVSEPIIPPTEHNETIPKDIESICLKALNKDYRRRYSSCKELIKDLDLFTSGYTPKASQESENALLSMLTERSHLSKLLYPIAAIALIGLGISYYQYTKEKEKGAILGEQIKKLEENISLKEERAFELMKERNHKYNVDYRISTGLVEELRELIKEYKKDVKNINDLDKVLFYYDSLLRKNKEYSGYFSILDEKFDFLLDYYNKVDNSSVIYEKLLDVSFSSPDAFYILECFKRMDSIVAPQEPFNIFHESLQYFNKAIDEFPDSDKEGNQYMVNLEKSKKSLVLSDKEHKTGYEQILLSYVNYRIFDFYSSQSVSLQRKGLIALRETSKYFTKNEMRQNYCKHLFNLLNGNIIIRFQENFASSPLKDSFIMAEVIKVYRESLSTSLKSSRHLSAHHYVFVPELKKAYFLLHSRNLLGEAYGYEGVIKYNYFKEKFATFFPDDNTSNQKTQAKYHLIRSKLFTDILALGLKKEENKEKMLQTFEQYRLGVRGILEDCEKHYRELRDRLNSDLTPIERLLIHEEASALYDMLRNCSGDEIQISEEYQVHVLSNKERIQLYNMQDKYISLEVRYGGKVATRQRVNIK